MDYELKRFRISPPSVSKERALRARTPQKSPGNDKTGYVSDHPLINIFDMIQYPTAIRSIPVPQYTDAGGKSCIY